MAGKQDALLEAVLELHAEMKEMHLRSEERVRKVEELVHCLQGEGTGKDQRPAAARASESSAGAGVQSSDKPRMLIRRDVEALSNPAFNDHADYPERRRKLLTKEIHILKGVYCGGRHESWVRRLLHKQAGSLVELQLFDAGREHLLEVQRMPRLRVLHVESYTRDFKKSPGLPEKWLGCGLQRFTGNLPKVTLRFLLRHSRHSLQELELAVRAEGLHAKDDDNAWPYCPGDLPALLRGLPLRILCLLRDNPKYHEKPTCSEQMAALRAALPDCAVSCSVCGLAQ